MHPLSISLHFHSADSVGRLAVSRSQWRRGRLPAPATCQAARHSQPASSQRNQAHLAANKPAPLAANKPPGDGVRINKCLNETVSRRESDRLIAAGRVTINGIVAVPGARVQPGDRVALDGRNVAWEKLNIVDATKPAQEQYTYIKYWKPRGVVSTTDRSVAGNVADAVSAGCRLVTVGRLDKDSTGLLLLTTDGRVVNALLRSEQSHAKRYVVAVDRPLAPADVQRLASGVVITTQVQRDRGGKFVTAATLPCEVRQIGVRKFCIELKEGRNRQIRKMCEALGYEVVSLHRDTFAGITLRGLSEGRWRNLDDSEMDIVHAALARADQF